MYVCTYVPNFSKWKQRGPVRSFGTRGNLGKTLKQDTGYFGGQLMGYRLSRSDNAEYPTGKMLIFFAGYGIF